MRIILRRPAPILPAWIGPLGVVLAGAAIWWVVIWIMMAL